MRGQFHAPASVPPGNESALETWWAPELGLNVFEDRKCRGVPGNRTPIYRSPSSSLVTILTELTWLPAAT